MALRWKVEEEKRDGKIVWIERCCAGFWGSRADGKPPMVLRGPVGKIVGLGAPGEFRDVGSPNGFRGKFIIPLPKPRIVNG